MKNPKVAVYGRVSTDEQKEKQTIETQVEKAKDFCKLHDLEIYDFYLDEGISGIIPFEKRPAGKRLLEDITKGLFTAVIVYKLDRIGRDIVVIRNFIDTLSKYGISFRSITEPFDTSTAFGKSFMELLGVFAGFERSMIMERSKAGKERIAKEGKYTGGRIPLGYKVNEKGEYEIDDKVIPQIGMSPAEIVRYLFHSFLYDKKGTKQLAEEMRSKGIPLPYSIQLLKQGKIDSLKYRWTDGTVYKILTNEFYKGIHYFGKWKKREEEPIKRKVPTLIEPEVWDAVNEILKKRGIQKREKMRTYLFTSLIKCGKCGHSFVGITKKRKNGERKAYTCISKTNSFRVKENCKTPVVVGEKELDFIIWSEIKSWLDNPEEAVNEIIRKEKELLTQKGKLQNKLSSLEKELKNLKEKEERTNYAFINGFLSKEKYHQILNDLKFQKETLESEILNLKENLNIEAKAEFLTNFFTSFLQRLKILLRNGKEPPLEIKKEIYHLLVDKIIVYPNFTVKVIYKFKPVKHKALRSYIKREVGMNREEYTYEKVYKLPHFTTAKEIIKKMSCEELQKILKEAKDPYKLEKLLGFTRLSLYKYLKPKMKDCFFTAREYAEVVGIPYPTLMPKIRKGEIPAFRYAGKYFIPKKSADSKK